MKYMLHVALASAVALTLAAIPANAAAKPIQKKAGAAAHSMTGCLAKGSEAKTYTLTNVEGNGPKTVEIVESTADLSAHVGHKVTITGTTMKPKAAAKAEAKAEGKTLTKKEAKKEAKEEAGEHVMKVTAVKMIASSCS